MALVPGPLEYSASQEVLVHAEVCLLGQALMLEFGWVSFRLCGFFGQITVIMDSVNMRKKFLYTKNVLHVVTYLAA